MTAVGSIGARRLARVDRWGAVTRDDMDWRLDWWIGADDRWRIPTRETTVRQRLIDDAPVVETAMRVPGGDARQRAYGVGDAGELVAVEVENASPAPFVVALVVRGARHVAVRDATVLVDGRPALAFGRRVSRWAAGADGRTEMRVVTGKAEDGEFRARRDRAGRLEAAFLHPVAHRTTLRAAVVLGRVDPTTVDVTALPSAEDAARGWAAQLRRGMQVDLPDERLARAVRRARAALLLESSPRRPRAELVAALEDWGFDTEAAQAWERLSTRGRRAAARRADVPPVWSEVDARSGDTAEFLLALRAALVHEGADGAVTLLASLPRDWRGRPLEVDRAPTRHGPVSFALRWHGERAALLWDAPAGVPLRAPALDPRWTSTEPSGEVLLATSLR